MKKFEHPNIVRLYDSFETVKEIYLIQEYISGVSLYQFIKNKSQKRILPEEVVIHFFRQIAEGVRYLHGQRVCHRDLKLENIIIDDRNNVKIIDFGFSVQQTDDAKLKVFCGTPSYMAPEIIQKKEYNGYATDIWSLGIILFVMLAGMFPFNGATEKELYGKICRGGLFHMPETIPFEARRLIQQLLHFDPHKRLTAKQLCADRWIVTRGGNIEQYF